MKTVFSVLSLTAIYFTILACTPIQKAKALSTTVDVMKCLTSDAGGAILAFENQLGAGGIGGTVDYKAVASSVSIKYGTDAAICALFALWHDLAPGSAPARRMATGVAVGVDYLIHHLDDWVPQARSTGTRR